MINRPVGNNGRAATIIKVPEGIMRRALLGTAALGLMLVAGSGPAAAVDITFARFFGACEADYGTVTDVSQARGECGIITALTNKFNATNPDGIVVKPQIIEWNPYYDQLTARIASRDVPAIAVMHTAVLGDYARRRLVEPLDKDFAEAGIDVKDFTPHSKEGVTVDGKVFALPWDTHSWLWHFNTGMLKQAGLVDANGEPMVPKNVDELFAAAKKFKEAIGKPLFIMASSPDKAANARTFYSMLYTQGGTIFPKDYNQADFSAPEVRKVYDTLKRMFQEGYVTPNLDYSGATAAFLNGAGGIYIAGTWLVDSFMENQAKPDSVLKQGYEVRPFPNLFTKDTIWADGHSYVLLRGGTDAKTRKAALSFMKFLYDNNFEWARAGHLPSRQSVVDSEQFKNLPHRGEIARITEIGQSLPDDVKRQFGIQSIIGEEIGSLVNTGKTVDQTITDTQNRVNALLANAR
jgi:multiple sugar transport system substrate-binding protein